MMPSRDEVVVTGFGLVSSLGLSVPETWSAVRAGRCGLGPISALESHAAPEKGGGQAPDARAGFFPGRSREVRYLRLALDEALAQARCGAPTGVRVGVVMGTTLHGMRLAGEFLRGGDVARLGDFLAGATLRRALEDLQVFGRLFDGPAVTTCAACSSGLSSVGLAMTLLHGGELDVVIAGGYDPISEYAYAGFDSLRVVSSGALRPFCRGRDGMKLAEGYGVLVLERASGAAARGAGALAAIRGYGESSDAHHLTLPHPEGDGAARAIAQALARAGAAPAEIGLIAAHATATPNNDAGEYAAFRRVFGTGLAAVPVVGFKSHIGHTLGGAGAVELILSIMALREGVVPPTANADDVEFPDIALNIGPARSAPIRATLNTSLGFGGANTCVIAGRPGAAAAGGKFAGHDVAITGIGVVVPGAVGNAVFLARLRSARTGLDPSEAGPIAETEIGHLINSRRVRRMSDYVKLTLAATALALDDAGVGGDAVFAESCSVILGTTHGSATFSEEYYGQLVRDGLAAANPVLFAEGVPNAGSAQLSLMLGVKGGCQTIIGTRTAGLDALRLAALRIAAGEWDRAIVGAGEELSAIVERAYTHCGLRAKGGWSPAFGDPGGFVSGAGAVTLILERREIALAEGRTPKGLVVSGAAAFAPAGESSGVGAAAAGSRVLSVLGPDLTGRIPVVGSANSTWIDRVEAIGLAKVGAGRVMTGLYGWVPELFSAGPLAAVAAVLLSRRAPARVGGDANAGADVAEFDVLGTDYAGTVAGVRLRLGV
jgi:3-oxoacyl-[acyl-carrier-protein] synthase II